MKNRTTPVRSLAAFLLLCLFALGCNWSFNTGNSNNTNSNAANSNAAPKGGGNSNGGARNSNGTDSSRANGNTAEGGSGSDDQAGGGQGGGESSGGEGGGSAQRGGGGGGRGSGTVSITIVNDANYDIFRVFMSPTREQNWGPDQLGSEIIRKNGGRYTLRNIPCDNYDIRLVDEDNDECIMRNVSFCDADREWRISNEELLRCQAQSR